MKKDVFQWRRALHIPVLIILQILFIILFGIFVVYDPETVGYDPEHIEEHKKECPEKSHDEHDKHGEEDPASAYAGYPSMLW